MELLKAAARAWGLMLTVDQLEAFELYYQELIAWNERVNLTAITDYEEVQIKHFLDSLSCLQVLTAVSPQSRCIDIGAGAGFPGLPLKIVRPEMELTLLESVGKKVGFLEHIVRKLGVEGVEIVKGRAEALARRRGHRESYQVALARAVAELPVLVEYALPLVRRGGVFVAQKGFEIQEEVESARPAIALLGGRLREVRPVQLATLAAARRLVVIDKVAATPDKYPRRVGIPAKRPLTGL